MVLEFLLRHHERTGDAESLAVAEHTLTAMARGGIYDQLAGGFARYSVDAAWVVPHFEKMLYDNALLVRAYTHWYRLSGSELAARVVAETVEFLLRELRTDEGGFASSLDADTDGVEGLTYVWTPGAVARRARRRRSRRGRAVRRDRAGHLRGRRVDAAAASAIPTTRPGSPACASGCSPPAPRVRSRAATTRW